MKNRISSIWNRRTPVGLLVALIASLSVVGFTGTEMAVAQDENPVELSRALQRKLKNNIVPALTSGNDALFMEYASPIFESGDPDQFEAIENFCRENGHESIQPKYVDLKVRMIVAGMEGPARRIKLTTAALIASELNERVRKIFDETETISLFEDPLIVPADWRESEEYFWKIHVAGNQLTNASRMLEFSKVILTPHFKNVQRTADATMVGLYEDVDQNWNQLRELHRDMMERKAEAKLKRLVTAHRVLINPDKSFEDKLFAASVLEIDGPQLINFLKHPPAGLQRDGFKDPVGLLADIETKIELARESNEDVITKAALFRNGLHYWYRGRYGAATEFFGLLKPESAMNSQMAMESLYMPKERPGPEEIARVNEGSGEWYPRRHLFTWAAEYRPLGTISEHTDDSSERLVAVSEPVVVEETRFL